MMLSNSHTTPRLSDSREESLSSTLIALAIGMGSAVGMSRILLAGHLPREPGDVVVFLAAIGAALLGGWWVANVFAWCLALRRGAALRRFTLPGTRRLAQLLLILSLSSACVARSSEGPTMVLIDEAVAAGDEADQRTTTSSTGSSLALPTTFSAPSPPSTFEIARTTTTPASADMVADDASPEVVEEPKVADEATGVVAPGTITAHGVIVREGDNLWALAAETLQRHGLTEPSSATVAAYWRLVVADNQVRSGDANLIVPGETIDMPAYDTAA